MSTGTLVFVTQQVDPEHPVLAATVPKLRALATQLRDWIATLPAACALLVLCDDLPQKERAQAAAKLSAHGWAYTMSPFIVARPYSP